MPLDRYFDPAQLGTCDTDLGVTLSNGPILLLHDLGNCPDDVRFRQIFEPDTVFVLSSNRFMVDD